MRVFKIFYIRAPALLLSLVLLLSVVFPVPAYADGSTPSDAFYDLYSLDPPDSGYYDSGVDDEGIALYTLYQTVPKIQNTVSFGSVYYQFAYNNTQGGVRWTGINKVSSDGHVSFSKPSDYASLYCMEVYIERGSLPPTGKYAVGLNILPSTGITYPSGVQNVMSVTSRSRIPNSTTTSYGMKLFQGDHEGISFDNGYITTNSYSFPEGELTYDSGGDFYAYLRSVQVYRYSETYLMFTIYFSSSSPASMPLSLDLRIRFAESGSDPVFTMVNPAPSTSDALDAISGSVSGIADGINEISAGIENVVSGISTVAEGITNLPSKIAESLEPHYDNILTQLHHITEQLHAFWDQLAAYFNDKLIPQMITDTDRIVDAINDIDLNVEVSLTELVNTLNKNHKELLDSDQKIHEEQMSLDESIADDLKNGYDTSAYAGAADDLKNSLEKYESQENELLSDVQDNIDGFTFENPFLQFVGPLQDLSYFLTVIYTGLGRFNIPIAFQLTLSIALICVGWYRFKGG